jgi:hypothetical protein
MTSYGMTEAIRTEADIEAEIDTVLAARDDPDACSSAYGIIMSQFEEEDIIGRYASVLHNLDPNARRRLILMAARAIPDSDFIAMFDDWIIEQVADLITVGDVQAAEALRDLCSYPAQRQTVSVQETISVHLQALRGWSKVADHLPPSIPPVDGGDDFHTADRQAWSLVDELVFGQLHGEADPTRAALIWAGLLDEYPSAAVDVIWRVYDSDRLRSKGRIHHRLLQEYPDEVRRLLEWGLTHPQAISSAFRDGPDDRRDNYIIHTLGQVGTASTATLLRGYAIDPVRGEAAVAAVQSIEQRIDPDRNRLRDDGAT